MISILLTDGKIIYIKATKARWRENSQMIELFNDGQIVAEINIENVVGWINADYKSGREE